MTLLFEYGEREKQSDITSLEKKIRDIWINRKTDGVDTITTEDESDDRYQPILQLYNDEVRAKNYVGFIQDEKNLIEIYPKVFRNYFKGVKPHDNEKNIMLRHVFYWINYCDRWRFPFSQASLANVDFKSFPELIIYLIANQFLDVVSTQPISLYQYTEEPLSAPKGAINFKRYINNSLSHGKYHQMECDHEPFLFDNVLNRAIKYCSRILMQQTKRQECQRILEEVVFILDEVEDVNCSIRDLDNIHINSHYEQYLLVIDTCKIILNQKLYSSSSCEILQWNLLFPMEYIFEDFLAGFIKDEFSGKWDVCPQESKDCLAKNEEGTNVFQMRHDILITSKDESKRKIIIDTKYKIRPDNFKADLKRGIDQGDLYQMVSYALRSGCTELVLVYPNISESQNDPDYFRISSELDRDSNINITAIEIPFWSMTSGIDVLKNKLRMVIGNYILTIKPEMTFC